MNSVYLETTVVGHIAGRLHPDLVINSRQIVTRRWWDTAADRYHLYASNLVLAECSAGDADAASDRLSILRDVALLDINDETGALALLLVTNHAVPDTEPRDATHIAVAAINGIDFLATWNFKHIMNPSTQHLIDAVCRDSGYEPATICTPEQILEAYDDS
ncbi:MAG: type II toxin-antitoxin system VapC family toxin [Pirellulaceae bacterium]